MHTPNHQPLAIEAAPERLMIEPPRPGTDLVPTTYDRQVWNAGRGVELQHHDDRLNAEQAKRINDHFSIDVFGGNHGTALSPDNPFARFVRPEQKDYDAAASVVNNLRPGDTLFVEGFGFKLPTNAIEQNFVKIAELFSQSSDPDSQLIKEQILQMRADLEKQRANHEISAWRYASTLATLNGVTVVNADMDAFEKRSFGLEGKGQAELIMDRTPAHTAYMERIHAVRENRVRNIVKDWALERLPPTGTPPPSQDEKPRLVLLFGKGHLESLTTKFKEIGLHVTVHEMVTAEEDNERLNEQLTQAVNEVTTNVALGVAAMAILAKQKRSGATRTFGKPGASGILPRYRVQRFGSEDRDSNQPDQTDTPGPGV